MKQKYGPWSGNEVVKLALYAGLGKSARFAAKKLRRGYPATKYKAMVEGIRFFSVVQPAGVQKRWFRKGRK